MTDVGLRIRVEPALRRDFADACKAQDLTASQVLRAFMREFVDRHRDALQTELRFDATPPTKENGNDETSSTIAS